MAGRSKLAKHSSLLPPKASYRGRLPRGEWERALPLGGPHGAGALSTLRAFLAPLKRTHRQTLYLPSETLS